MRIDRRATKPGITLLLAAAIVPLSGAAQAPASDCGKVLAGLLSTAYRFPATPPSSDASYGKLVEQCIADHRCVRLEQEVMDDEATVDAELVKLWKQKLLLLQDFILRNKQRIRDKDYCTIVTDYASVSSEFKSLDEAAAARAKVMLQERVAALPKP